MLLLLGILATRRFVLPRQRFQPLSGFFIHYCYCNDTNPAVKGHSCIDRNFFVVTLTYMVRPTMPTGEARQKLMQVRVQEREYEAYQDAAERAGVGLSEWVRGVLARTAKRQKP